MITMGCMQAAVMDEIIMVTMLNDGMLVIVAMGMIFMLGFFQETFRLRINVRYGNHVFVGMCTMGFVQMAVMEIIDMALMGYRLMAAIGRVVVIVPGVQDFMGIGWSGHEEH